jgi:hypothetical protein
LLHAKEEKKKFRELSVSVFAIFTKSEESMAHVNQTSVNDVDSMNVMTSPRHKRQKRLLSD